MKTESEDVNWDSSDYSTQAGQQLNTDSKNMAEALENFLEQKLKSEELLEFS